MASIRSGIGENMEDRYLFKAKHFKEWHIGNIVKEPDGLYIRDINKNVMAYINDESTICQCTGLKDKNGKLIWENDIIECKDGKHNFQTQIEWDAYCAGFIFQDTETSAAGLDAITANGLYSESKVIGNIFDNKDLLESEG